MKLNQVGEHIESECVGCGEPLLIASGDSVNFRMGTMDGLPFPEGFLCYSCNKKENGDNELVVKMQKMCCVECGAELDMTTPFEVALDDEGEPRGMICLNCKEGEEWKR